MIPAEQPYFGGLTWARRLGPVLGRPDIPNLGYWIFPRVFPGQDPPGYVAPGIIGEAWANFGPAGWRSSPCSASSLERLGALLALRRRDDGDLVAGSLPIVFLARTHALGVNGLAVLVVARRRLARARRRRACRDAAIGPGRAGVASLTTDRPAYRPRRPAFPQTRWIGLGLVAALVVLAVLRIALGGWAPLAPDDARYLYVGLRSSTGTARSRRAARRSCFARPSTA